MTRSVCFSLTLLVLAAATNVTASEGLKPLVPGKLADLRKLEPQRITQLSNHVSKTKASLGLGPQDGLKASSHNTDAFGTTHVRYQQTYQDVEVFNGTVIGHLDAKGRPQPVHATVQKGIDLPAGPLLTTAQIEARVATLLPKGGKLWPMQVRQLVFPTRYQEGIKFSRDRSGALVLDTKHSVGTPQKKEPYVWAYQVGTLKVLSSGIEATNFIVDARTGEVLRKWDGEQHFDAPATGTGNSQYNGTVTLDTTFQDADNQYALVDSTRPTLPWKRIEIFPYFTEWNRVGIQTLLFDPNSWNNSGTSQFLSADNIWGDGNQFDWLLNYPNNLFGANSQTTAVDAHFGILATWDYYAEVLGRTGGLDGLGSSPVSLIHVDDGDYNAMNNASWVQEYFMMMYGDGDGDQIGSLTTLDVAAHEVSHGVFTYTTNLSYGEEGGGISEANSDIHATMTKYWMWGANGTGSVVPDSTTDAPNNSDDYLWSVGPQMSANGIDPLRRMDKPSSDGRSYDAWFDGIGLDDSHFSMGPGNRLFYFLSRGASNVAGHDHYSPYLPEGMTGIGNDKAVKIWFNAMSTKVTDMFADYHAIREAVVAAAEELYPSAGAVPSTEVAAVKNAFAAVNIGASATGAEPIRVRFSERPNALTVFYKAKQIVLPAMVPVKIPAPEVSNSTDTRVSWSPGGINFFTEGGKLSEDGSFTAPAVNGGWSWPVTATSRADSKQFAVNIVWSANMDADSDTETDACDLGAIALDYVLLLDMYNSYPGSTIYRNYITDDLSIMLFTMGFNNAFNN